MVVALDKLVLSWNKKYLPSHKNIYKKRTQIFPPNQLFFSQEISWWVILFGKKGINLTLTFPRIFVVFLTLHLHLFTFSIVSILVKIFNVWNWLKFWYFIPNLLLSKNLPGIYINSLTFWEKQNSLTWQTPCNSHTLLVSVCSTNELHQIIISTW